MSFQGGKSAAVSLEPDSGREAHPGGVSAISRGLSRSDHPRKGAEVRRTPEGCQLGADIGDVPRGTEVSLPPPTREIATVPSTLPIRMASTGNLPPLRGGGDSIGRRPGVSRLCRETPG